MSWNEDWGNDIILDINLDNIEKSIKDFDALERAIDRGLELGIDELCSRIHEKMLEQLAIYGLAGSNLASTVEIIPLSHGISIGFGAEYAMYVEFGTGVVGSENPHPHAWEYDINEHGADGWTYIGKDGKRHWTAGQRSHPVMYNTWLWASRSANSIIMKNIRREMKKVVSK